MTAKFTHRINNTIGDLLKNMEHPCANVNTESFEALQRVTDKAINRQFQIAQVVQQRSELFLSNLRSSVDNKPHGVGPRALILFDVINDWVQGEFDKPMGFVGCEFINKIAQVANQNDPIYKSAVGHKSGLVDLFAEYLNEEAVGNAEEMALRLQLLVDGAIMQAQIYNDRESVSRAKALAKDVLSSS